MPFIIAIVILFFIVRYFARFFTGKSPAGKKYVADWQAAEDQKLRDQGHSEGFIKQSMDIRYKKAHVKASNGLWIFLIITAIVMIFIFPPASLFLLFIVIYSLLKGAKENRALGRKTREDLAAAQAKLPNN